MPAIPKKIENKEIIALAESIDELMMDYGDPIMQAVMNVVGSYRIARGYNAQVDDMNRPPIMRGIPIPGGGGGPVGGSAH